uniref:Uncharacterized protein n=1 Tax=Rhizophora mucronata TaxID=61149 RepID=A0A2P2MT35_RHIMU
MNRYWLLYLSTIPVHINLVATLIHTG